MVDKCDILVSYVNREYGGAYKPYSYAMKKNKEIYNLVKNKKLFLYSHKKSD